MAIKKYENKLINKLKHTFGFVAMYILEQMHKNQTNFFLPPNSGN
jgi:hypothetical protein